MASRLGELLCRRGLLTPAQLAAALAGEEAAPWLAGRLVDLGFVAEDVLTGVLAAEYDLPVLDLAGEVARAPVGAVPHTLARRHHLVPVALDDALLTVATADPTDAGALAEVRFLCGLDVRPVVASPSAVRTAIVRLYGEAPDLADALSGLGQAPTDEPPAGEVAGDEEQAPVVRYVQALLAEAVRRRASDIHVEPFASSLRIRLRVDGVLVLLAPPPPGLAGAITNRVKVMAHLDIAERRVPQDGRLHVTLPGGGTVDVRVSVLPTLHGEKLVLRLLDRGQVPPALDRLGLDDSQLARLRGALAQPHGLVLVTGPTGSGKTTTLYAALAALDTVGANLCTVEDPVEMHVDGVNQVPVRDDVGLSFATTLRALLRQDPDVIMVGEIRDLDTADIAVKAALTGHLVLSTLHTNDAPSAVTRLLDMGIAPFLVAGALVLIVGQRLVRVTCGACAERRPAAPGALRAAGWAGEPFDVRHGVGCAACGGTGFHGRAAVYEMLPATDDLRERMVGGAGILELRRLARAGGMRTLRQAGLLLAAQGLTTVAEVLRVTPADGPE